MIPINILKSRSEIEKIQAINSLPAFVPFVLIVVNQFLFGSELAFFLLFICSVLGASLSFFPFYFNSKLFVSHNGIELRKRHSLERINWDEIKEINFIESEPESNYDFYKCYIILNNDRIVKFYISKYLLKRKDRMLVRVIDLFVASGGSGSKISDGSIRLYKRLQK